MKKNDSQAPLLQHDYPSVDLAQCPHAALTEMRLEGGIHRRNGESEYVITDYDLIQRILRDPDTFSASTPLNDEAESGWGTSMFSVDGAEHESKRKMALPSLSPQRAKNLDSFIATRADAIIDGFVNRSEIEFVREYSNALSSKVLLDMMGLDPDVFGWISSINFDGIGTRFMPQERQEEQAREGARLQELMRPVVESRIASPGDDLISELIKTYLETTGNADPDYITVESHVILIGGILTPAHMMSSTMLLLLQHPEQLSRVVADHSLIPNALEEGLRLEAPDQFMPRYAKKDVELGGVSVAAGSLLLLVYASGNRDERIFSEAGDFNILRANARKHLSFGHGTHFCIGAPLARQLGKIGFSVFLDRLSEVRLQDAHGTIHFLESVFNRAPREFRVAFSAVETGK